ncbi:5-oxoprolinase subunit PxpA [Luteimonas salinilitoris]|uniref:5-oxoprolinase subunit PxpA n=1 Tax=Luteimonas salinilitoris TaxID=3237697 RepID=A0ABV4HNN7_9GAMM
MRRRIDFNCDLGEGCDDAAIVPCISSASIACGGHAGDDASMRATVALCLRHGVAIGAHPSFEDRAYFGRRELPLSPVEAQALVLRQCRALMAVCDAAGARLHHVKPHGALYNLAARDPAVAEGVAAAVHALGAGLWLYALAGSELVHAGRALGLHVAEEVFAERGYEADGRLTPRGQPGAVIEDLDGALAQVRTMLREGVVQARDGSRVPIRADTLCLHGDRPDAAAFARALRAALEADGIAVAAP